MRLIGMILALGAIVWVMYQSAGGGNADSAIPQSYQESIEKAENLEQDIQATLEERLENSLVE